MIAARARKQLRLRNPWRLEKIVRVDAASGVIGLFAKSGPRNRIHSSKVALGASRTTSSIAWLRRNRDSSRVRDEGEGMPNVTGMTIVIVFRQPRLRLMTSSPEMKTRRTKESPNPIVRAVPVADVVDEVAEQLGIARLTKRHRSRRTRDLRTSHWPMTTMASARVWPHHAAARNAAHRSSDRQRIVGGQNRAVPIEGTDPAARRRTPPRKTPPANPRHVLAGTATKAPTALPNPPARSGVRATSRIGPPVGMKVAEISLLGSPPHGVEMMKPRLRVRIAEIVTTDQHGMTEAVERIAPRIGNPQTGGAMPKPGPLAELLRVLIETVANVMTVRPAGSRPNVVAKAKRRDPRTRSPPAQALRARTAVTATAMTDLPVVIGMIALPAVTRLPVQIVRRETALVARNQARRLRRVATGMRTMPMRNVDPLAPSHRPWMPRLGNTPSLC